MAMVHCLYKSIVIVDVCIESKPLEVEVPLTFSGTVGFPRHRDGGYPPSTILDPPRTHTMAYCLRRVPISPPLDVFQVE